jgi:hypothetical protein
VLRVIYRKGARMSHEYQYNAWGAKRGERRLTGGPAQCRAAVPLTGGSGLSGARESVGRAVARERVGRLEKKRRWAARMHSTVLDLFEVV